MILFYPIIPGSEDESWERFLNEGLEKLAKGLFEQIYGESLDREFKKTLPEIPLWKKI